MQCVQQPQDLRHCKLFSTCLQPVYHAFEQPLVSDVVAHVLQHSWSIRLPVLGHTKPPCQLTTLLKHHRRQPGACQVLLDDLQKTMHP